MSIVYSDGLSMIKRGSLRSGGAVYRVALTSVCRLGYPSQHVIKRLAEKFLDRELTEIKRDSNFYFFSIPAGTSAEDRAAFLGAFRHHCETL